jgi:hypothetical protein
MIRVIIPFHLCTLAGVSGELSIDVSIPITITRVLDALESKYPALRGTIRDHDTKKRRDFVRFFACNRDFSNDPPDTPLPPEIAAGTQPFLIIGAIAGG